MQLFLRATAVAILLSMGLSGCGGSSSGGDAAVTANTIVVSRSTVGTITAVANGGSRNLTLGFNSSDSRPISNLHVTGLSTLPAGWSGAAAFDCATVGSGNGCVLNLTYAPAAFASGTFTLTYTYTSIAGNSASGSIDIAFAATVANNVVATASPAGQVAGIVNATRSVVVTFATDDGNPASGLVLTSDLAALPTGWSSNGATFGCASVAGGGACQLSLDYTPVAIGGGTLALDYSYLDNSGVAKSGTLNIPYSATSDNNVIATASPSTPLNTRVGDLAQTVTLTFATDDGNAANAFTITSPLPSGWSGATGVTCGGVIVAGGCQVPFSYAPTASASGTFTVTYSYSDNSGVAKTGSVDIGYSAKTAFAYVASAFGSLSYCPISSIGSLDSCIATGGINGSPGINGSAGITFQGAKAYVSDNTSSVYVCDIDSAGSISSYCVSTPLGAQQLFTLASTATHLYAIDANSTDITYCSINLDGSLSNCAPIATSLTSPSGIAIANGTAYIADSTANTVTKCTVDPTTGNFPICVTTSSGFNQPFGIRLAGAYAYVANQGNNTVSACPINSDGSFAVCSDNSVGSGPSSIAFLGNRAYVTSSFSNSIDVCDVDLATGVLSTCINSGDPLFNLPLQLDIH